MPLFFRRGTLLTALLALLAGCQSDYRLSEAQLQQKIDHNLPYTYRLEMPLFQPKLVLDQLDISLALSQPDRLGVTGAMQLRGIPGIADAEAEFSLDGKPEYNPEQGALYLRDVQIRSVKLAAPKFVVDALRNFLSTETLDLTQDVVDSYFERNPLYRLKDDQLAERTFKQYGRSVDIEQGELVLRVGGAA